MKETTVHAEHSVSVVVRNKSTGPRLFRGAILAKPYIAPVEDHPV